MKLKENKINMLKRFAAMAGSTALAVIILASSVLGMWTAAGCEGGEVVITPAPAVSGSDNTVSGGDVSGTDTSASDTTAEEGAQSTAATTDTTAASVTTTESTTEATRYPQDHEDVFAADYKSPYYIVVYTLNCSTLVLGKDENGKYTVPVKAFLCSPGTEEDPTNAGVYPVYRKHTWRFMMEVYGHYATGFGDGTGYLFHSVPYREEMNNTLTSRYDDLGQRASHGCVRLCARDAKWIFDNIPYGTQVHVVYGKNGPAGEPVPMRVKEARYAGWDPTDPDPANPYNYRPPAELTYFTHTSAGTQATTAAPQE